MATRQHRPSRLRALIIPLCALAALGYFGWHGWYGDSGVLARRAVEVRLADLRGELARTVARRDAIERRLKLLRSAAIDRDMLDERARAQLGFAHANDLVVFHAALQQY